MTSTDAKSQQQRRGTLGVVAATRELPTTPRGIRTREKLVDAARTVFERDGFLDARLIDITTEAGISAGSFYTYFDSKEEVFSAVLANIEEEMLHPHVRAIAVGDNPVDLIRASNHAYLDSYRRNVKLMKLLDQVASIDEEFRNLRRRRGEAFTTRNARSIQELQDKGVAKATVDPMLAASILSGMVGRAAYSCFVLGDNWEFDDLVEAVTQLWANALLIDTD